MVKDEKRGRAHTASCENCDKKSGGILSEKLNPKNWVAHRIRLCPPCRHKLGYTEVFYGRSIGGFTGKKGNRN